jgi:recombinational DNA repair ATPase RecF
MKLHRVELRNVRHIKELTLDLSASLTVIAGPNGCGKTTLQKAILQAMFHGDKKARDELISRFDPHTPPQATLHLSRGASESTIRMSRPLIDEKGEWIEDGVTIKKKGMALEKIQEALPICASAAASLLWGLQEDLAKVVSEFPSDGHSLLTAATIQGAGPNPKEFVAELEREIGRARKGGQEPGPLTRSKAHVDQLTAEKTEADIAHKGLQELAKKYEEAKELRNVANNLFKESEAHVQRLEKIEKYLEAAIKTSKVLEELETKRKEWDGLDEKIGKHTESLKRLKEERHGLQVERRVAKDGELVVKIERLNGQIKAVEEADKKRAAIDEDLLTNRRPDNNEDSQRREFLKAINDASSKIKATGVNYLLSVMSSPRIVKVSEEGAPYQEIQLTADRAYEGVVGKVEILVEDLRFTAGGKEDIALLKGAIKPAEASLKALYEKFGAKDDNEFDLALDEKRKLTQALAKAEKELERELKGSTAAGLRTELELAEKEWRENDLKEQDRVTCQGKYLGSVVDIEKKLVALEKEIQLAEKALKDLQLQEPDESKKAKHDLNLKEASKQAKQAISTFRETDEGQKEPSAELFDQIKKNLADLRKEAKDLKDKLTNAEINLNRLASDLKHAGPKRPLSSIEADLVEAINMQQRQQTLQDARILLKDRIEKKTTEMASDVPSHLGERISAHLSRLSCGAFGNVHLADDFAVTAVSEDGQTSEHWQPHHLSTGERHQTALAVKIAVARALAETSGPVFVILDDCLASFDPHRRSATEKLLTELVADGKLQVIFLTCHTDWAEDWRKREPNVFHFIELEKVAVYYRAPRPIADH